MYIIIILIIIICIAILSVLMFINNNYLIHDVYDNIDSEILSNYEQYQELMEQTNKLYDNANKIRYKGEYLDSKSICLYRNWYECI